MKEMTKRDQPALAIDSIEQRVESLLATMTQAEKIGQMRQVDATGERLSPALVEAVRTGQIGSVINQTDPALVNELQRIAMEESRMAIPLLIARDVIHGFKTIFPIPLGQAATWNPAIIEEAARTAANEAARSGVNWTFAPMVDISRDPRWGRIAESFGEDPYLSGVLGAAMTRGFQEANPPGAGAIAACAKHFAGYGASESGRDYSATNIPENELRNVYLPPFKAVLEAGAHSIMASFSDIDGVPASANAFLFRTVLREEWRFDGIAVSDWNSVSQLSVHGITADDREAAEQAALAGIDIEMAGNVYECHLDDLAEDGIVNQSMIDEAVANILRTKFRLGLFENPYTDPEAFPAFGDKHAKELAVQAARESIVLLKNDNGALPLNTRAINSVAIIGPLADAPYEQLGTWVFDGDVTLSVTPLTAIRELAGAHFEVRYAPAMESTRSRSTELFEDAVTAAQESDVVVVFLGEESILSGEAHSRANIDLPGNQADLIKTIRSVGKPVIAVIMAGRPLTLGNILDDVDALLFAWHPGTMAGPAISDLLFGRATPSGRLPVTFPKVVGQIPIYYNHKNTGRPPTQEDVVLIDDIPIGTAQTSLGMTAFHMDAGFEPQFPFGFGLSYTDFQYTDLIMSAKRIRPSETLRISAMISNVGDVDGAEVVQLYIRDLVGSVTRPVRELKAFSKIHVPAGLSKRVTFDLSASDLGFWRRDGSFGPEPGEFHLWVGPDAKSGLFATFSLAD